jgi:hypothetical protein
MGIDTLYLNRDGSKWVTGRMLVGAGRESDMRFVLVTPDGARKLRKADYYESFGNFACVAYRYKGKRYRKLPAAHDGHSTRDPDIYGPGDTLLHVFHKD